MKERKFSEGLLHRVAEIKRVNRNGLLTGEGKMHVEEEKLVLPPFLLKPAFQPIRCLSSSFPKCA